MQLRLLAAALALLISSACLDTQSVDDPPIVRLDAGGQPSLDAQTPGPDAGPADSGAAPIDAGASTDAGEAIDAGNPADAGGALDAGSPPDAGAEADAGIELDAGTGERCGNGAIEDGEQCDTQEFGELSCRLLGYASGTLSCQACEVDASGCSGDGLCDARGWCWTSHLPQGNALYAVFVAEDGKVWAGGANGTVIHWDGTSWGYLPPVEGEVLSLWVAASNDLWAIAGHDLAHWDGAVWTKPDPGNSYYLNSVSGLASDDVWFAGSSYAVPWDGEGFEEYPLGSDAEMRAVHATADGVWAAGKNGRTNYSGAVWRWDGAAWLQLPASTAFGTQTAVWVAGTNDVWSAGTSETLVHSDATGVTSVRSGLSSSHFWSMWARGPSAVWAVGDTIWHWDGSDWSRESWTGGKAVGGGGARLWVVGAAGHLTYRQGNRWLELWSAAGDSQPRELRVLSGAASDNVWVAGNYGAWQWNGQRWVPRSGENGIPNGTTALCATATEAWGTGPLRLHHWNGAEWLRESVPNGETLYAITASASGKLWAVGKSGASLHFDGNAWSSVATGTTQSLWGVFALSDTQVWAVGSAGTLLSWSAGGWVAVDTGFTDDFFSVSANGADDLWITPRDGTVVRWNGESWERLPSDDPWGVSVTQTWGRSSDDLWSARGWWNGTTWDRGQLPLYLPSAERFWGLASGVVWAADDAGVLVRR